MSFDLVQVPSDKEGKLFSHCIIVMVTYYSMGNTTRHCSCGLPRAPFLTVADLHRSGNGKIAHNREQKGRATTGILMHTTQNTTAAENTREKSAQEKTTFRHKRETAVYSACAGSNPNHLPKTHQRLSAARQRGNRGGGAAWHTSS